MAATREATRSAVDVAATSPALYAKLTPGPGTPAEQVARNQRSRIYRALIDLVASQGYGTITVRGLVGLAGVSTRTFYERFAGKEDCLLKAYDAIAQSAAQRVFAARAYSGDQLERQGQVIVAFVQELERDPKAARLALVDARDAGPAAREHVERMERSFEAMFAESVASPPGSIRMPPLVAEAVVAGALGAARSRLSTGLAPNFQELQSELVDWASCYLGDALAALAELDGRSVWRNTALEPSPASQGTSDGTHIGDRTLILAAAAELAASRGYACLTTARIRAGAGVSRQKFDAHFTGVEDCFLAALEWRSREACAQIARAREAGRTPSGGVYRALIALSDHMANDRLLAHICVHDDFAPSADIARARQRLISTFMAQIFENMPYTPSHGPPFSDPTASAVWSLLRRHVFKDSGLRGKIAATLSFVALAPGVGGSTALSAVRDEQA